MAEITVLSPFSEFTNLVKEIGYELVILPEDTRSAICKVLNYLTFV